MESITGVAQSSVQSSDNEESTVIERGARGHFGSAKVK